jgi:hypothetical protein
MPTKINRVTNANLVIEGGSTLGQVSKVELPDLTAIMVEHEGIGLLGKTKFFAGYETMEATFTFNAFYPDTLRQIGDPYQRLSLALYANMDVMDGGGLAEQIGVVTLVQGTFMNFPLGSFSQMENVDGLDLKMCVTYIKQVIGGADIFEFDAINSLLRVNGVELSATLNRNLGL